MLIRSINFVHDVDGKMFWSTTYDDKIRQMDMYFASHEGNMIKVIVSYSIGIETEYLIPATNIRSVEKEG